MRGERKMRQRPSTSASRSEGAEVEGVDEVEATEAEGAAGVGGARTRYIVDRRPGGRPDAEDVKVE